MAEMRFIMSNKLNIGQDRKTSDSKEEKCCEVENKEKHEVVTESLVTLD